MPNTNIRGPLADHEISRIKIVAQAQAEVSPHRGAYLPLTISLGLQGVRPCEICSLTCDDVSLSSDGGIYIRSGKDGGYWLPLTDELWWRLMAYLAWKKQVGLPTKGAQPLFQNGRGRPLTVKHLSKQIGKLKFSAELGRDLSIHDFRITWFFKLLTSGKVYFR